MVWWWSAPPENLLPFRWKSTPELIRVAVEHAAGQHSGHRRRGRQPTDEAIHLARHAKAVGAQAGLSVVPYYNKPNQEGIYRHFPRGGRGGRSADGAVINVPGRTVADMSNDTVLRLAEVPGIIGIRKPLATSPGGALLLREAPAGFQVFSGDDPTAAALILLARAVIFR